MDKVKKERELYEETVQPVQAIRFSILWEWKWFHVGQYISESHR